MKPTFSIGIQHVTRVEGHGNIVLDVKKGRVEKVEWQISEAPRFFEMMLKNRCYKELQPISSRICGICSIGHSIASLKATEEALGVEVTEQTILLRKLALHGENIQSHILHLGYLVLPDLLGMGSVFPLANSKHKKELLRVVSLHRFANEFSELICGRTTHPIRLVVGGFTAIPKKKQLELLKNKLLEQLENTQKIAEFIHKHIDRIPCFERETEYIALTTPDEYAFYDGVITSTDTGSLQDPYKYREYLQEYFVPYSTALHSKHNRESYMVGALARLNLNHKQLHETAGETIELFKLKPPIYNPFMNNIAQLIEIIHSIEDSMELVDKLLDMGLKEEKKVEITRKSGHGVGIVEVPRGLLVHEYKIENERCTYANCVIPTNQNHANIQRDLEEFAPMILDKPKREIELLLEMLVRAYDPCISCSTHYLNIVFKES